MLRAISLSLAGLPHAPGGDPRADIIRASAIGFNRVHLDAARSEFRPRELDRSARRDLAALLRRAGLEFSGLDLWIPPAHFADPQRQDRAVSAVLDAIDMAAEVGALARSGGAVVSVRLPPALVPEVAAVLAERAHHRGVSLADHAPEAAGRTSGGLGVGIDPAALLIAGHDPAAFVAALKSSPASARISDARDGARTALGRGTLDLHACLAALDAAAFRGPLIADLRDVPSPEDAARAILAALA